VLKSLTCFPPLVTVVYSHRVCFSVKQLVEKEQSVGRREKLEESPSLEKR
jgi:hypothetical protein